jgi:hypothetical protein
MYSNSSEVNCNLKVIRVVNLTEITARNNRKKYMK